MSLVRAFTTRRNRSENMTPIRVGRAASQRNGKPVSRSQISSPLALVSTTNMLSYNAPSIAGTAPIQVCDTSFTSSSASSEHSVEDSDGSSNRSLRSHDTTDASSIDESAPVSPEPNHLSCYFKPNVETGSPKSLSRSNSVISTSSSSLDTPRLPQRAASHSKKAHERLSRKRSVQRMISPPSSSHEMRPDSAGMFSSASVEAPERGSNPFMKELAQLDEVAEELGHVVRDAEAEAETAFLQSAGLAAFSSNDYLNEIHGLISSQFDDERTDFGGFF